MKKIGFCILTFFCGLTAFGQIKEGSKALTSTISFLTFGHSKGESTSTINPTLTSKTSDFTFTTETTYGTVKNNHLFSYGLHFAFGFGKQFTNSGSGDIKSNYHRYGLGPVISYQKFYEITERLYYSPFSKLGVTYQYYKQAATTTTSASIRKGIAGTFTLNPFSITFAKNSKTNFLFTVGNVLVEYTRTKSYFEPILNDSKTTSTTFLINAQIAGIGFGIQKLF